MTLDRVRLLDRMKTLPAATFEELVFHLNADTAIPGREAIQAVRAIDLIRWVESKGTEAIEALAFQLERHEATGSRDTGIVDRRPLPSSITLADLCCRCLQDEDNSVFRKTAGNAGLTSLEILMREGQFERWYTLIRYCQSRQRLDLIEDAILAPAEPGARYAMVWQNFQGVPRPAGEWSQRGRLEAHIAEVASPSHSFMPLNADNSAHRAETLEYLGLLAINRIRRPTPSEPPCEFFDQATSDLRDFGNDQKRIDCLKRANTLIEVSDGEFSEPDFAFGVAAACIADRLLAHGDSTSNTVEQALRNLIRGDTPARYALAVAVLQGDERVQQLVFDWRRRLLKESPKSLKSARRMQLFWLMRVTRVLLDSTSLNQERAVDEIVEWARRAQLDLFVVDLMLQLGVRKPARFLKWMATTRRGQQPRIACLRAVRMMYDEDDGIELPDDRTQAQAIRAASLHATIEEIRDVLRQPGVCSLWLDLLSDLPSEAQRITLADMVLGRVGGDVIRCGQDQAMRRLIWHPEPEVIWSHFDHAEQLRWLNTLATFGLESDGVKEHLAAVEPRLGIEAMERIARLKQGERMHL